MIISCIFTNVSNLIKFSLSLAELLSSFVLTAGKLLNNTFEISFEKCCKIWLWKTFFLTQEYWIFTFLHIILSHMHCRSVVQLKLATVRTELEMFLDLFDQLLITQDLFFFSLIVMSFILGFWGVLPKLLKRCHVWHLFEIFFFVFCFLSLQQLLAWMFVILSRLNLFTVLWTTCTPPPILNCRIILVVLFYYLKLIFLWMSGDMLIGLRFYQCSPVLLQICIWLCWKGNKHFFLRK